MSTLPLFPTLPELFKQPLVVVDVETNGLSAWRGSVIEMGMVRVDNGQVTQTVSQLINPGSPLPAFISSLTGISSEEVADAPAFADMADDWYDLLEGCVVVAHNARFDYSFLKEEFRRSGYAFNPPLVCTVKLCRSLFPQLSSYKLGNLITHFGIRVQDRHRAYADAVATWQLLQIMADQSRPRAFEAAVASQYKRPSLPRYLDAQMVADLPDTPGVYIFEGEHAAPLYVGKSVHVKQRVMSHFAADHMSAKELKISQEVVTIKTVPANGELEALLLESKMVKELLPLHNRQLRQKRELVVAVLEEGNEVGLKVPRLVLERHEAVPIELLPRVMAVYNSERQAKETLLAMAKEYRLCQVSVGVSKAGKACFAYQLGKCNGVCCGQENGDDYRQRLLEAFAASRLQAWPYAGAVAVTEQLDEDNATTHIIDQWRVVAQIKQRGQEVERQDFEGVFDVDEYKILKRFLSGSGRGLVKPVELGLRAYENAPI